jgi:hypothetical protein
MTKLIISTLVACSFFMILSTANAGLVSKNEQLGCDWARSCSPIIEENLIRLDRI